MDHEEEINLLKAKLHATEQELYKCNGQINTLKVNMAVMQNLFTTMIESIDDLKSKFIKGGVYRI